MAKSKIVIITILVVAVAAMGYLTWNQRQAKLPVYAFSGQVAKVDRNVITLNATLVSLQNGRQGPHTKVLKVSINSLTKFYKTKPNGDLVASSMDELTKVTNNGFVVARAYSKTDPEKTDSLSAYRIDIISTESTPVPSELKPIISK